MTFYAFRPIPQAEPAGSAGCADYVSREERETLGGAVMRAALRRSSESLSGCDHFSDAAFDRPVSSTSVQSLSGLYSFIPRATWEVFLPRSRW